MSRAAQAVQRAVNQLKDGTDDDVAGMMPDDTRGEESKMAKRTRRAGAKKTGTPRGPRATPGPLPAVDELRLAPGGIRASGVNRCQIEFTDGLVINLLPMSGPKSRWPDVRDLLVAWLNKRSV